jgi:Family of unknown function (DUF6064)
MLPFTEAQFFELFGRYNEAIWPAQLIAYCIGAAALLARQRHSRLFSIITLASLAALWAWTGGVYHGLFFAEINPAARLFAVLFVSQALLLAAIAFGHPIDFTGRMSVIRGAAWMMILYALAIYPLLNTALGHSYPQAPTFGLTPCPLAVFTFGILGLSRDRAPWLLFVAPLVWSLIGGSAAFLLGVEPDWALPLSALAAVALNASKPKSRVERPGATQMADRN